MANSVWIKALSNELSTGKYPRAETSTFCVLFTCFCFTKSVLIKTPILIFVKALNQLFEKIMALDIEERHLLRLGHGEEALETEKDFSRFVRTR